MANKEAEFTKFNTDKAAYETKKTDYNTKLAAAEKLTTDTLKKDIFRLAAPTADDLKILNAVPTRPNNPSVPAAYAGPKKSLAATTPVVANTFVKGTEATDTWDKILVTDYTDN